MSLSPVSNKITHEIRLAQEGNSTKRLSSYQHHTESSPVDLLIPHRVQSQTLDSHESSNYATRQDELFQYKALEYSYSTNTTGA